MSPTETKKTDDLTVSTRPVPGRATPSRLSWLILFLLCVGYLLGLSRKEVWNNAEARVLLTSREMAFSGDYVVPRMLGEPRYEKPPLMYWAVTAVARIQGGIRDSSGYWISALSAVFSILVIAALNARLASPGAGALAGLMAAASPGIFAYGRQAELDSLFMATNALSLAGFSLWLFAEKRRWAWLALAGLGLGLALLTKGPYALVFSYLPPWAYLLVRRRLDWRRAGSLLSALAIGAAPIVIWLATGQARDAGFLPKIREVLAEQTGETNIEPFWYYFEKSLVWLGPWLALGVLALVQRGSARRTGRSEEFARFCGLTFLLGFLVLSAFPAKQRHYVLPLLPWGFAWIGLRLDALLAAGGQAGRSAERWVRSVGVAIALACLVGAPVRYWLSQSDIFALGIGLGPNPAALAMAAACGVCGFLAAIHGVRKAGPREAASLAALAMSSLALVFVVWIIPIKNRLESPKAGLAEIRATAGDFSRVLFYKQQTELCAYYMDRTDDIDADTPDDVRDWFSDDGVPRYIVFVGAPKGLTKDFRILEGIPHVRFDDVKPFTSKSRVAALVGDADAARAAGKGVVSE